MESDSERESKHTLSLDALKEQWQSKQEQFRSSFDQIIEDYQREFNGLVLKYHETTSNLFQRLCLSLLSFVFVQLSASSSLG